VTLLDLVFQHWSPRSVTSRHNDCLTKRAVGERAVGKHPIDNDGLWLDGHTVNGDNNATDRLMSIQFGQRRQLLANHLRVFRKEGPILEDHN
jgi:hypothetical protein